MSTRSCECMGLHDVTEVATDVEISASEEARAIRSPAHGGRVFVWISVHPGIPCALCLLETSFEPPRGDLGFRRVAGPGFDVYLEATQRIWPRSLEFGAPLAARRGLLERARLGRLTGRCQGRRRRSGGRAAFAARRPSSASSGRRQPAVTARSLRPACR